MRAAISAIVLSLGLLLAAGCAPGTVTVGASVGYYDPFYYGYHHPYVSVHPGYTWRQGHWYRPGHYHRLHVHRHYPRWHKAHVVPHHRGHHHSRRR